MSKQPGNKATITIPANSAVIISGATNAAYNQFVRVTDGSETAMGLYGSGENNTPMKSIDGGDHITLTVGSKPLEVTFEFLDNPYPPADPKNYEDYPDSANYYSENAVISSPTYSIIDLMSEDSKDNDDNDSYITVYYHSIQG